MIIIPSLSFYPLFFFFSLPIIGNDSGSTGDASSTAGEAQSPDAAASAIAAASGAALQQGYDGAPLVCFPSKLT